MGEREKEGTHWPDSFAMQLSLDWGADFIWLGFPVIAFEEDDPVGPPSSYYRHPYPVCTKTVNEMSHSSQPCSSVLTTPQHLTSANTCLPDTC